MEKLNHDLKIELYPDEIQRGNIELFPLKDLITKETLAYSFPIDKSLSFVKTNVPLLNGFLYCSY